MIRILHVVPNMQSGGIETFIMNIYRKIDKSKIQFDFLVHYKEKFFYDDEIEHLGGKIYRLSIRDDNNIIKYIKDLNEFFSKHKEYTIVHGHMASTAFIYLKIAKKYGVKTRIIHSHGSSYLKNFKGYMKKITFSLSKIYANQFFACSNLAGKYLFKKKHFIVIHNAINVERFRFSTNSRNRIRSMLNIDSRTILIGHIGRFNKQKNHIFLIELLNKLIKNNNNGRGYKLLLIGNGELKSSIMKKAAAKKLLNNVIFLENIKNTEDYYCAMDCFLLPSLFEGLPVVGIEAQASNLNCIFANTISTEVAVSNDSVFLPLKLDIWMKFILEMKYKDRNYDNINLVKKGYSDVEETKRIYTLYEQLS